MKTKLWFVVVFISIALFNGASPVFSQDVPVKPLEGTIWNCKTDIDTSIRTILFEAEGKLGEASDGTISFNNAWHQEGTLVTIKFSDGYAVYKGEFSGPSSIKGAASNVKNKNWTFEMTQMTKPADLKRWKNIFKAVKDKGVYTEITPVK